MYSAVASAGSDLLFNRWRSRRLHTVPPLGVPRDLPADRPLLFVANHTSWWDGFLVRDVHLAMRGRAPIYTAMTEAELRRHPVLRLLGALPLDPASSASLLRLLRTLQQNVQQHPDASALIFPQGRIWPAWRRPLGFRRGVELVLRSLQRCYVLPTGIHVEAMNRASPTAFMALGFVLRWPEDELTATRLEDAVATQLDRLGRLLAEHGEVLLRELDAES